jgi:hypothetical protein
MAMPEPGQARSFDFDRKLWKGIADEAGLNAVFHPQTHILKSWLSRADQPPEEHPCLEVAGVQAYLYVDPQLPAIRLSLHLEDVIKPLRLPDGESVPLRVMVNETVVYDATDAGDVALRGLLASVINREADSETLLSYLRSWSANRLADVNISHTSTQAAAHALTLLDERLRDHGALPLPWCQPRPRPAEQPVPAWSELDPEEARKLTLWFGTDELGQRILRAAAGDDDYALWLAEVNRQHDGATGAESPNLDSPYWLVCFREGWTPARALASTGDATVIISDDSLICPKCGAKDSIREEDWAVRWNTLHVGENGAIFGGLGDSHFEHLRFVCNNCHVRVQLLVPVDDYS